jgi:hypothetical protein
MGVLWQGDRLDPESIVLILERERRAWSEAASAFERLKPSLVSGVASQEVNNHVHSCRARAEALKRFVARLCEQFNLPSTFPDKEA